jgi:ABC-type branched-subunit amino acid transport system substrate-binding protein
MRTLVLLTLVALIAGAGCARHYADPDALPLAYRQAEDAFRLGDYERAVRAYRVFVEDEEDNEDLVPRAYYKMALAEFRRERYGECLSVLNEMERHFPNYEWHQTYTLRGDAELRRGNTVTAMLWWERAWDAAERDDRRKLTKRLEESIATLNRPTLVRARAALSTEEIRELIDARIQRLEAGAPEPAPRTGSAPGGEPRLGADVAARLGCLLPLSGPHAIHGRRSLNGVRLALGPDADKLVVKDTIGQVAIARNALDELIADPAVVAIIGPLRSEVAAALAPEAEKAAMPMITLSQRDGIAGRYVMQPTMTHERQAAALAEHAVGLLGLRRYGIIHSADAYGTGLAEAFRQQVTQRNGVVVGAIGYAPTATEFSVEVLTMEKWADEGLDAVFLPGYADTGMAVAQALRRKRPNLTLLGSNGWHDPPQLMQAAQHLDGLIFVDGFFAQSRRRATRDFVAAYESAYHAAPEILEAQAYDAAALLLSALRAGGRTRADIVPQLGALRSFDGVAGTIALGPSGIQRELFVLQLVGGIIREATPGADDSLETTAQPVRPALGADVREP